MLINNVYILAPQIWGAFFVINFSVCAAKNHKIYFVLHLLCFIFVINYKIGSLCHICKTYRTAYKHYECNRYIKQLR